MKPTDALTLQRPNAAPPPAKPRRRLARALGWNRTSYAMLSAFLALLALIVVVWWPLAEEALRYYDPARPWWRQMDWLLIGDFLAMTLLIMAGANLRADARIAAVGLAGGLAIEGWGTLTGLWSYYTLEQPPLWILPAWPIAALAWNRLTRLLDAKLPRQRDAFVALYWVIFPTFLALMLAFVRPSLDQALTVLALLACLLITLSPTDHRRAVLTFAAGAGLGYFLELWGTTRACWTYYTQQTPPLFAVLAHGMAAVAVWRVEALLVALLPRITTVIVNPCQENV